MNDTDLWAEFRKNGSESAFRDLVRRHTRLVYSVARRRLNHDLLAQEATQLVFIKLAKAVPRLSGEGAVAAWLHRVTIRVSIDLWRAESRRRAREEHAAAMQDSLQPSTEWTTLAPVLDAALDELKETDRRAILLRYFQDQSLRELSDTMGVGEGAAKMRLSRALQRLRQHLAAHGVTLGTATLGALLSERTMVAAPAPLMGTLESFPIPAPAGLGAGAMILSLVLHSTKAKIACGLAAALVIGSMALVLNRSLEERERSDSETNPSFTQSTRMRMASNESPADIDHDALVAGSADEETGTLLKDPDPMQLLKNVAAARRRIASGYVEFQIGQETYDQGKKETTHRQLQALFQNSRFRFKQVEQEYSYALPGGDGAEEIRALIEARNLGREAAVQEGLLEAWKGSYVTTYDGEALFRYSERDGRPMGTSIFDPSHGSHTYAFDPRCLGLRIYLSPSSTIEGCLALPNPKSVELVGLEQVEGASAWHVRVVSQYDETLDFWMDSQHPERVLSHGYGSKTVISRFDRVETDHPLPKELIVTDYRHGTLASVARWHGFRYELDKVIDPAVWTLAGLGMQIGTSVSDDRISRSIGYWNGFGLSERLPRPQESTSKESPDVPALLAALETEPTSEFGFQAASWIILNTPDRPEVEKAATVIRKYHTHRLELKEFCEEQERVRHRSSKELLEAILFNNPASEVQAVACFTLATILKDEADHGRNREALDQAIQRFEQVIDQFAGAGSAGAALARRAQPELYELRHLTLGQPAPELTGMDMSGREFRLSDHLGKVVLLYFWSRFYDDIKTHHKLLETWGDQSFTLITINCTPQRTNAVAAVEEHGITWPTIWDGRDGPIARAWNNHGWPFTYVIDRQGVIRFPGIRGELLNEALEQLIKE